MKTIKAIVEGIEKKSKPQMQKQRYNGFRNRHWNNNAPNNVRTNIGEEYIGIVHHQEISW